MHKKFAFSVAVLILSAVVWASNEPWKTKPYQQWDKADLAVILNNSPWAKKVVVDVNWTPSNSQSGAGQGDTTAELRNHMDTGKGGMPDTSPPDRSMDTSASSGSTAPQASFYLRWYSSRVMREALAREAVLNGRISDAEAAKLLAEPVTDYEIIVLGPDMTPFQKLTEDQLKSAAFLEGKESKQKVAPVSVRLNRSPNGATSSVAFVFPKKSGSGQDVASTNVKGLEFACKLKGLNLRYTFEPRKMSDASGPDF